MMASIKYTSFTHLFKALQTNTCMGIAIALILCSQLPSMAQGFTQTKQVNIEAQEQLFDPSGSTTFKGKVHVTYDDYQIFSDEAVLKLSAMGEPSVATFYPRPLAKHIGKNTPGKEDTLRGDKIRIHLQESRIEAEGDTVSYVTSVAANPIQILADHQQFNNNTHTVTANGNVDVTYEGTNIKSPQATMWLSEGGKAQKVVFSGGATAVKSNSSIQSGTLTIIAGSGNMVAEHNVKTHVRNGAKPGEPSDVYITSAYQQYDNDADTMLASGNVKIDYGDYKTSGPKATFRMKSGQVDTILLTGRSTITTNGRQVTADQITITTSPKHFDAVGNVKSQFLAKQQPAAKPAPAATKSTPKGGNTSLTLPAKEDTTKPADDKPLVDAPSDDYL